MTIEYKSTGFMKNPEEWTEDIMFEIANREGITLTPEIIVYVMSARDEYDKNQTVPVLREFSKLHGGDRKGKIFDQHFHGGTMKKIAKLGGLPSPTGCV